MKKPYLFLFLISMSFADTEIGCSVSELLETSKKSLFDYREESNCTDNTNKEISFSSTNRVITENLISVKVLHEAKEVLIQRESLKGKFLCPPFCIEPMNIKEVETVAELEVLAFIDKLKEKKARLLIDVRESNFYAKGTIAGAINLPFSMLEDTSRYQEEVLKLLGAEVNKKSSKSKNSDLKWSFKNAQFLLIFGSSAMSSEAANTVKKLLKLGYPASKLLYYRAGISSWKALGLTIY